jgi:hypothetical protein
MNDLNIFNHFQDREILSRGLNYKSAITATALVFSVGEKKVEQVVLEHAASLQFTGQEMALLGFPSAVADAAELAFEVEFWATNPKEENDDNLVSFRFRTNEESAKKFWDWAHGKDLPEHHAVKDAAFVRLFSYQLKYEQVAEIQR